MWLRRSSLISNFKALRKTTQCPWILFSSYSCSDTPKKKSKIAPLQERKMIDRFRLSAKGGDGGNGCASFRRSRHERKGTPDGGNGGRGGDVILECSPTVYDFRNLQHHTNAKRGGHGVSKNKIGSRGGDKVLFVPVGTVIHLVEGEVPTVVENRSLKALDPWDVPGGLESDPSDSVERTTTNTASTNASEIKDFDKPPSTLETSKENSASICKSTQTSSTKFHSQPSSLNKYQSSSNKEEFLSYSEEEESENGDLGNDDGMKESELDEDEEEEQEEEIQYNVAELTEPGQRVIVAHGGEGGLGNASFKKFSKSNKHMKDNPHVGAASNAKVSDDDDDQSSVATGLPGSEAMLVLELKSIADVGLVGMPNAGKSTLLGAISKAKPTVGHYAFTTLRPNIGNLNYDDFLSVTVADIPGLIKGAHENRGLGHAFLRHIERTKVLAYVVDLAAALDGRKGIPPWEQLRDLVLELEYHQTGLSDKPSLVVANKIDEEGAEDVYEELRRRVQGVPIFPICAVLEEGVPELKLGLRSLVHGGVSQRLEFERITVD